MYLPRATSGAISRGEISDDRLAMAFPVGLSNRSPKRMLQKEMQPKQHGGCRTQLFPYYYLRLYDNAIFNNHLSAAETVS